MNADVRWDWQADGIIDEEVLRRSKHVKEYIRPVDLHLGNNFWEP